jgi:hypothetical protein
MTARPERRPESDLTRPREIPVWEEKTGGGRNAEEASTDRYDRGGRISIQSAHPLAFSLGDSHCTWRERLLTAEPSRGSSPSCLRPKLEPLPEKPGSKWSDKTFSLSCDLNHRQSKSGSQDTGASKPQEKSGSQDAGTGKPAGA